MKKGTITLVGIAVALVILGFFIPTTVMPANDTRVIVDHTLNVYSAPECFDEANLTNNLEETTLGAAIDSEYKPESMCTFEAFKGEKKPLLLSWL